MKLRIGDKLVNATLEATEENRDTEILRTCRFVARETAIRTLAKICEDSSHDPDVRIRAATVLLTLE